MKDTSQYFAKKNILFKELKEILPKELKSKKKDKNLCRFKHRFKILCNICIVK